MAFPVEEIPDQDRLFHHIAEQMFVRQEGRPSSACVKKHPELSVNWEKYSSVEQTRRKNSFAIVSLVTGFCRDQINQEVIHSPIQEGELYGPNRSHSDIKGNKQDVADQMARQAKVEWRRDEI